MSSKHTGVLTALTLPAHGKLLVGHVGEAGRDDPAVKIPAREYRFGDFFADARGRHCPARSEIDPRGPEALLLVIHRGRLPGTGGGPGRAHGKGGCTMTGTRTSASRGSSISPKPSLPSAVTSPMTS